MVIENPFFTDITVSVPNPNYKGLGYKTYECFFSIDKDQLELISTYYPIEESYYRHKKYPDYKFFFQNGHFYCCDANNQLIAVNDFGYAPDNDQIETAVLIDEFEHNKYNIHSDDIKVQQWVSYLLNIENIFPDMNKDMFAMTMGIGSAYSSIEDLHIKFRKGRLSKNEYLKELADAKKKLEQEIQKANNTTSKYPSKENRERAENYINQLKVDYYDKYKNKDRDDQHIYDYSFHYECVNGLQYMYVTNNRSLKVLKSFYLDDNGKLQCTYSVI